MVFGGGSGGSTFAVPQPLDLVLTYRTARDETTVSGTTPNGTTHGPTVLPGTVQQHPLAQQMYKDWMVLLGGDPAHVHSHTRAHYLLSGHPGQPLATTWQPANGRWEAAALLSHRDTPGTTIAVLHDGKQAYTDELYPDQRTGNPVCRPKGQPRDAKLTLAMGGQLVVCDHSNGWYRMHPNASPVSAPTQLGGKTTYGSDRIVYLPRFPYPIVDGRDYQHPVMPQTYLHWPYWLDAASNTWKPMDGPPPPQPSHTMAVTVDGQGQPVITLRGNAGQALRSYRPQAGGTLSLLP